MTTLGDIVATEKEIDVAKRALTGLLTTYVNQFNAGAPRSTLAATLTTYVNQFNALTALTNALKVQIAELTARPGIIMIADTGRFELSIAPSVSEVAGPRHLTIAADTNYFTWRIADIVIID